MEEGAGLRWGEGEAVEAGLHCREGVGVACCGWRAGEGEGPSAGRTWVGAGGRRREPLGEEGWPCGAAVGAELPLGPGLGFSKGGVEGLHREKGVGERPGSGLAGVGVWIRLKQSIETV